MDLVTCMCVCEKAGDVSAIQQSSPRSFQEKHFPCVLLITRSPAVGRWGSRGSVRPTAGRPGFKTVDSLQWEKKQQRESFWGISTQNFNVSFFLCQERTKVRAGALRLADTTAFPGRGGRGGGGRGDTNYSLLKLQKQTTHEECSHGSHASAPFDDNANGLKTGSSLPPEEDVRPK